MRRGPIRYSDAEMGWLEENRMMIISDYYAAFLGAFDRQDVTATNLHSLRKRMGWKVGRNPDRYKGRRTRYTAEEIAFLAARSTMLRPQLHALFQSEFGHPDLSLQSFKSLCKREGLKTGRDGRFAKGQESPNKGKPMSESVRAKCLATAFKKGAAPPNRVPLWSERVGHDGYLEMKVPLVNPYTGRPTRFMHKHRYLWEQVNGPLPDGMALKCLDGDRTNCAPENWEAVPRGMLPRLNNKAGRNYDAAPDALKPTLMLVAKVEHSAHQLKRGK